MINFNNTKLKDMLPTSLKRDNTFLAITKVLQPYIDDVFELIDKLLIIVNIDNIMDENIIDHLAYQFHVDFYDDKLPISKKKELIKSSIADHKIKGTPYAVEKAINLVFGKANLKEWYEYDGEPYFFKVDVDISDMGVNDETLIRAETLINHYKNTRSWLESIRLYLTSEATLYAGSSLLSDETISVYPYTTKDLISKSKLNIDSAYTVSVEAIAVKPRKEVIEND